MLCLVEGKPGIIEYSDMPVKDQERRDGNGKLLYRAGNVGTHIFSTSFLESLQDQPLPFHRAEKNVAHVQGGATQSGKVVKFEKFIFDVLPYANGTVTMMVDRDEEYAPLKNKEGDKSIATVIAMQNSMFASWLDAAGVPVPRKSDQTLDGTLEISPLYAHSQGFLERRSDLPKMKPGAELYLG